MSLEKLGEGIAKKQISKPGVFIFILFLILLLVAPGITLLLGHVEPSLEKVLPQQVPELKVMNLMRSQFGADMMFLLLKVEGPVYDVRDPSALNYMDLLESKLRENNYVLEVNGLPEMVKQVNNDVIPDSQEQIQELLLINPSTPFFLTSDYSTAIIQVKSDTGSTASVIKEVVQEMEETINSLETQNPGFEISITGFNSIDKATFEVIIKDFASITGFSFLFMLIFLAFYFGGDLRKVFMSVSVIMISLIITLGLTGYAGITITVVTMVAAAMIMALGISYGINITYEYYLLRAQHGKKEALKILDKNLIRALVGSSFTTSAGFLALLFGVIPAMKNLGIVLAAGIVVTLIVSILFLPVIIYLLDKEQFNDLKKNSKRIHDKK